MPGPGTLAALLLNEPATHAKERPMFVTTLQKDLTKIAEIAVGSAVVFAQSAVVGTMVLIASL